MFNMYILFYIMSTNCGESICSIPYIHNVSTISASSSESLSGSNIGLIAAGVSLFFTGLIFAVIVAVTLTLRLKKCAGGTCTCIHEILCTFIRVVHYNNGHIMVHIQYSVGVCYPYLMCHTIA